MRQSLGLFPEQLNGRVGSFVGRIVNPDHPREQLMILSFDEKKYVAFSHKNAQKISYYMPYEYVGENHQVYRLKLWGSHNAIYFPIKTDNEFVPEEEITFLFQSPFPSHGKEDEIERIVRLAEIECAKISKDNMGLYVRYFRKSQLSPSSKIVNRAIYDYVLKTNRVPLDGFLVGNVIVTKDEEGKEFAILIDRGDAFSFAPPGNPESSQASLERLSHKLYLYTEFLIDIRHGRRDDAKNEVCRNGALLVEALCVLKSFNLNLLDPTRFLKNKLLLNYLADIFESMDIAPEIIDEFKVYFHEDSLYAFIMRHSYLDSLKKKFNLSCEEVRLLRLDPSLYEYESQFRRFSLIFPHVTPKVRLSSLLSFYLLSTTFDQVLTVFSALGPRISEKVALNLLEYLRKNSDIHCYHYICYLFLINNFNGVDFNEIDFRLKVDKEEFIRHGEWRSVWFNVLHKLQLNDGIPPLIAREMLSGVVNPKDVLFIGDTFQYGLKKNHLTKYNLNGDLDKQSKIKKLLSFYRNEMNGVTLCLSEEKICELLSLTDGALERELYRFEREQLLTMTTFFSLPFSTPSRPASQEFDDDEAPLIDFALPRII